MDRLRTRLGRFDLGGLVVRGALEGIARAALLHPLARPERHGVSVTRDIAYGPAPWQRLDVWRPAAPNGLPLLYLHGGGFRILSKETHWVMALGFAREGYTVFMPDYRLAPRHPFPAALEDCAEALHSTIATAERWGCDPGRLVLAGESAGANLSVALTVAACFERPEPVARRVFSAAPGIAAVLPACGIYELTDTAHRGTRSAFIERRIAVIGRDYLRGVPADGRGLADVIRVLEAGPRPARPLPPVFAVCGAKDPIRLDTERLAPAWRRLGGAAEHVLYPGAGHAFHAFPWMPTAREAWRAQHRFLRRHVRPPHEEEPRPPRGPAGP
jgi:acetyl esterase